MRGTRASFGIDAPAVPIGMIVAAVAAAGCAVGVRRLSSRRWPVLLAAGYSGLFGASAALYLHTTLLGKFAVWSELLDQLCLRGDEVVCDLGCGRGAVLLAAARRVPQGRAIGVDLWRTEDQSGNTAEATLRNARALGVEDRVELRTADMADLPLAGGTVDLVVSNLAIHNSTDPARRARTIREAVRVLRPGGRIAIVDFRHTRAYERELVDSGMAAVRSRDLGWRLWYGGPWGRARLVTATRPG